MARINWGKISKQISESAALKDKEREANTRRYDAEAGYKNRLIDNNLDVQQLRNDGDMGVQGLRNDGDMGVQGLRNDGQIADTHAGWDRKDAATAAEMNEKWLYDQMGAIDKVRDHNVQLGTQYWKDGGDSNASQRLIDTPQGYADISGTPYPQPEPRTTGQFSTLKTGSNEEAMVFADPSTGTARILTMEELQGGTPAGMGQQPPQNDRLISGDHAIGRHPRHPVREDLSPSMWNLQSGGQTGFSLNHGTTGRGQQQQGPMQEMVEAANPLGQNFDPYSEPTPEQAQYLNQLRKDPKAWQSFRQKYENR